MIRCVDTKCDNAGYDMFILSMECIEMHWKGTPGPGDPGSVVRLAYEERQKGVGLLSDLKLLRLQEAVQHIEADLLLAVFAAEAFELQALSEACFKASQDACEATPELVELCERVSQPSCRDDTWDAVMYARIGLSWKTRRPELIWLDDKVRWRSLKGSSIEMDFI